MSATILHYALPRVLPQALLEQWREPPPYTLTQAGPGAAADASPRLFLLGVAADVPERLAGWRQAGLRAPALLIGAPQNDWAVTETLTPPFKLGRLLERMDYYAQLAAGQNFAAVQWGGYQLDPAARKLRYGAAEQSLTDKEATLLALLAREPGRAWGREDLLREIWGYDAALDTHTLETHIYRLRRKLTELGGDADLVTGETGYRLQIS